MNIDINQAGQVSRMSKARHGAGVAPTELETRTVHPDTALEVDIMILDYLASQTIDMCFVYGSTMDGPKHRQLLDKIVTTDIFLRMFKANHPASNAADKDLQLRIRLLQLVTLLTTRYTLNMGTPSPTALQELRQQNLQRARDWIQSEERLPSNGRDVGYFDSNLPVSADTIQRHRMRMLADVTRESDPPSLLQEFYGSMESLSLLDLLPMFMRTSAACKADTDSRVEDLWMELACEFMLQACLEQYLIRGAYGTDAIDEAFAWGYALYVEQSIHRGHGDDQVNMMFEDSSYEAEIEGWESTKNHYLDILLPPAPDPARFSDQHEYSNLLGIHRLEQAAIRYPFSTFQRKLTGFMNAVAGTLEPAILSQLEHGRLGDLSFAETRRFLKYVCRLESRAVT